MLLKNLNKDIIKTRKIITHHEMLEDDINDKAVPLIAILTQEAS